MSVFDLDNRKRIYYSSHVRAACNGPCNESWAKYRSELGIKKHAKYLTLFEAYLLFVRSQMRWEHNISKADLIIAASELLQRQPNSAQNIGAICGGEISADKLGDAIGLATGYYPSDNTLYRWSKSPGLPVFKAKATYSPAQLALLIGKAKKRQKIKVNHAT